MKKTLPFLIVIILVLSGLGAVAAQNENYNFEHISISFNQPIVKNEDKYITLEVNEANSYLMTQGKPMLPSYQQSFKYPFGTKIKSVTITPKNIQEIKLTKKILPTPKMTQVGQKVEINSDIMNYEDEPYPENWFTYKVFSGIDEQERKIIVKTEAYPVKYNPGENTIQWVSEFDINIVYEPPIAPLNNNADFTFVILTPSEFSSQLTPLVNHKIGRGLTTKLVTLTEVNSGTYFPATGRDDQEKIKYFIKNAAENWATTNVLLVGSASKFPIRLTHVFIEDDPQYGDELFVSDLYYADIYDGTSNFCSWDSNGNNIFGEYNWQGQYDDVDLMPDVNLGRWAARNSGEVTTCVNKDITYETQQAYQQPWFLNLVVAGGDSFPGDTNSVDEGEYVNQKVIDLMTGFIPNKQWASNGKLSSGIPTGVSNLKSAIEAGCGFIDFSGHGNTNIWATHPHENEGTWLPTPFPGGFWSPNVLSLSNGNKLPIVTVEACSTAKFNVDPNCFNWAFMYNSGGGSIGAFGATGLGYGYIGSGVIQGLIGKIGLDTFRAYKLDSPQTYGEIWSNCLDRYIDSTMNDGDHKTVEEWQAFGDPTIIVSGEQSNPPAKPSSPYGPLNGGIGQTLTYSTSTTDPDTDDVYYMFDWGDGTTSTWIGPYTSGATGSTTKTWNKQGTYQVKAIAKDTHGKLSEWSDPRSVEIPRTRTRFINNIQGAFYAEMGVTGNPEVKAYLNGQFRIRTRYTIFGGIATFENHKGRFRGIFFNNHFVIKAPIGERDFIIFGRCTFDENHETFIGQWRTRLNTQNGWINGVLNSS